MSFFISSSQSLSSITSLSGGGFVITWSSSDQDGDYSGIYAQRYDANGDALGEVSLSSCFKRIYRLILRRNGTTYSITLIR